MSASDPQPPAVSGLTRLRDAVVSLLWDDADPLNPRCRVCGGVNYHTDVKCSAEIFHALGAVDDAVALLTAERDLVRGAMQAQDEREQHAGAECGVPAVEHGCDWPDAVADRVNVLRAENSRLREERDRETDLRRRAEGLERIAKEEMEILAKQVPFVNEFDDMQAEVASLRATRAATTQRLKNYAEWLHRHNEGADRVVAEKLREIMAATEEKK